MPQENNFEEKFRAVIETVDVANALTEPLTRSIENLLRISSAEMNSAEASVIVRDGGEGDLRFLSAIGKVAERLVDVKIPAGKGIAGFVFSSGQPMAISDVGEEESFYADIDKHTGYSTQTILATPLKFNGEIVGVIEYVNRTEDAPSEAFTADEMDKAAIFAEAVAALVNAYESAKVFRDLGNKMLSEDEKNKFKELGGWLDDLRETAEHKEMIALAMRVREVAGRGEAERRMCMEILDAVIRFSDANRETSYLNF
ncbi:MAG: GAF domain-containing protein [Acidobacteriota bacterium]|nr:GAF domain-containing protein [Acidobacteriota bacterium]